MRWADAARFRDPGLRQSLRAFAPDDVERHIEDKLRLSANVA